MPDITAPGAAPGQKSHGHTGMWYAVCASLLFALLVAPEFLNGLFYRIAGARSVEQAYDFASAHPTLCAPVTYFTYPAMELEYHYPTLQRIYDWEFKLGAGFDRNGA